MTNKMDNALAAEGRCRRLQKTAILSAKPQNLRLVFEPYDLCIILEARSGIRRDSLSACKVGFDCGFDIFLAYLETLSYSRRSRRLLMEINSPRTT